MKNSYAILHKNKVLHIVSSEHGDDYSIEILKLMFKNEKYDVVKITEKTGVPKFENSEFLNNKFYDPRPFDSWVIKNDQWSPPKKYPNDGNLYEWDEENILWKLINDEEFNMLMIEK